MPKTGERERIEQALAEVEALRTGLAGGAIDTMPVETLRAALLRALTDLRAAYVRQLELLEAAREITKAVEVAEAVLLGGVPPPPDTTD